MHQHQMPQACTLSCKMVFSDDCTVTNEVTVGKTKDGFIVNGKMACVHDDFHNHCVKHCFEKMLDLCVKNLHGDHNEGAEVC